MSKQIYNYELAGETIIMLRESITFSKKTNSLAIIIKETENTHTLKFLVNVISPSMQKDKTSYKFVNNKKENLLCRGNLLLNLFPYL